MIKICNQCGQEYKTYKSRSKYCSSKCTGLSQSKKVKKSCENCGKEFQTSKYREESARYCSKDCRSDSEYKVGYDGENQQCTKCGEIKPLSDFYKDRPSCKECHKKKRMSYYNENKDLFKKHARRREKLIQLLPRDLSNENWLETINYFNNECAYCGTKEHVSQDHFIPISKNGGYVKNNIIPSCERCNKSKSNKDFIDWYSKQDFFSEERAYRIIKFIKDNTEGSPSGNRSEPVESRGNLKERL
jgi:HNH endonuclease